MYTPKLMTTTALLMLATASYAASPVTQFEYDANGNLTKITDGLGHATVQTYDRLNRLKTQKQPHPSTAGQQLGEITMGYNALDQRTSVTDPRNLATTYTPNAYGEVLTRTSPDTGTTTNTYDSAGNLKTRTDAKNQTTTYVYDALNRLVSASYADGQTITYGYDQTGDTGELTSITDVTGAVNYEYDDHGRVTSEVRTINGVSYASAYIYDDVTGLLSALSYPTGLIISYVYDNLGRVKEISSIKDDQEQILASNITYLPFGGVKSFTFGNGSTYTRQFDTDYRIETYTLGTKTVRLTYDNASRISEVANVNDSADKKNYYYDNLDRLTRVLQPNSNQGYAYDLTGNRTSLTLGSNQYTNTIAATNNRLTATMGPNPKTYNFDANGSIETDGTTQYAYDARGRMVQAVTPQGTFNYGINGLGQRAFKTQGSQSTHYHYDLNGQVIAETDEQGQIKQEVVYLGNIPLAVIK